MKQARIVLSAIVAAVLAAATIVEKINPTMRLYDTWWFFVLLALVAVGCCVGIVQGRMWKRPPLLLIHAALVLILLGGGATTLFAHRGSIALHPDEPASAFTTADGLARDLPFTLTLQRFEVLNYPGTQSPMDFVSHLSVDGRDAVVSMNNILKHKGYRFYQEDYDDAGGSILSVSHDPWGIGLTYAGYLLMAAGLLWLLASPRERFRRLLRGAAVAATLLLAHSAAQAAPRTLSRAEAREFGRLEVLYKGRICPMQTLAKDFTTKLYGNATYRGMSPEEVLCGWIFYFDDWKNEPMIKIKGKEVRSLLGTSGRYASLADFTAADGSHPVADALKAMPPMAARAKNLRAADEKYSLVGMLYGGALLKLFPVADSTGTLGWYSQSDALPSTVGSDEFFFIRRWLSYAGELVFTQEHQQLLHLLERTAAYQHQRAAAVEPTGARLAAERLYNALTTGRWLAMLAITLGLLAFAYAIVCLGRGQARLPRLAFAACALWTVLLTAFLLLIFVLRWVAGGHVPMAGGFDSMNLMAIAIGIIGLGLARRHAVVLPAGMLTAGFCLLVAMMGGANPPVTNLMPVLNSPLLSLHVSVIMFAYALFFFVMACGAAGLLAGRNAAVAEQLRRVGLAMLYPAVALLAVGIMIGAVWANISWGAYWSWDPKEVWALITLIVYAIPLHQGIALFRRPRAFHLYCLLAFLSVIVTYFGVNVILGGMHAYN